MKRRNVNKYICLVVALVLTVGMIEVSTIKVHAVGQYGVNLDRDCYQSSLNPFSSGQCTWYCYGRAYEKLGITLIRWGSGRYGDAKDWYNNAKGYYPCDTTPSANSIMVTSSGGSTGHVMFVEKVENGLAYITEANWPIGAKYHEDVIHLSNGYKENSRAYITITGYIHLSSSPDPEVQIAPGIYTIHSARDFNKVLDISGDSKNSGANIQLYDFLDNDVQKFNIIRSGDSYVIQSVYSGHWLDVSYPQTGSGANVQLWHTNENPEETWTFEDAGKGYVYIKNYYGNYLDISLDSTENHANIQVYGNKESDSQRWRLVPAEETMQITPGIYTIHSARDYHKVIDISGDSKDSGANIQLFDFLDNDVQKFKVIKSGNKYVIQSVYSGHWLDVSYPLDGSGANVQLWHTNANDEEKWAFVDAGNGYVYIKNYYGNYLDISGDSTKNHANIQVYGNKESDSQRWRLVPEKEPITVTPGTYSIHSTADNNMVLDIYGDSKEEYANIQLYHYLDNDVQKFRVIKEGNYYRFQSVYSGYWLDVAKPVSESHSNVQLSSVNTDYQEQWLFEDAGNGYVYIRNYYGNYLDIARNEIKDNANIQVFHDKADSQKWKLIPDGYTISIQGSGGSVNKTTFKVKYGKECTLSPNYVSRQGYTLQGWNLYRPADNKWYVDEVGWCSESEITTNGYKKSLLSPSVSKVVDFSWINRTKEPVIDAFTFYALWEDNQLVTVKFDANGGTVSLGSKDATVGMEYLTLPTPKWTNYSFDGWYTQPEGGTKITASTIVSTTSDHTLYAHWIHSCANGHNYSESVTEPTCTTQGFTTHVCSVCGDSFVDTYTETIEHFYINGECVYCGLKESVMPGELGVDGLREAIAAAESITDLDKSKYTQKSVEAMEKALIEAKTALAFATTQDEINKAVKVLNDTIANLEPFLFEDVKDPSKFYFDPVYWAYGADPQITNGIDETHFGPDNACTRGHVVTFLWRAAGCPEPKNAETPFKDLKKGAFYEKAVAWAVENEITNGLSADKFGPDATCTRGQIVTFLWRYQGKPDPKSTTFPFTDLKKGAFYEKAVAWAVENEVTNGMTATTFGPDATCTRGQVVTFLYRAMKR